MELTIELVPKTSWFTNLRSEVDNWDDIRKKCYKEANYKCEICGGTGPKHPVECHEIFEYDDKNHIQKLTGLVALCPSCHMVKHIGLAFVKGNSNKALKHMGKINNWDHDQCMDYLNKVVKKWNERSSHKWEVDLSWVKNYL